MLIAKSVCFYCCCYARGADDDSAKYKGYNRRKRRDEAASAVFRKIHLAYVYDDVLKKTSHRSGGNKWVNIFACCFSAEMYVVGVPSIR